MFQMSDIGLLLTILYLLLILPILLLYRTLQSHGHGHTDLADTDKHNI